MGLDGEVRVFTPTSAVHNSPMPVWKCQTSFVGFWADGETE